MVIVKTFFGKDGLDAVWTWYRFDWQKRGNIDVHGLARLHSDLGIAVLAIDVVKWRKAQVTLELYIKLHKSYNTPISNILSDVVFIAMPQGDIHLQHA
jgi:hypothetical protein